MIYNSARVCSFILYSVYFSYFSKQIIWQVWNDWLTALWICLLVSVLRCNRWAVIGCQIDGRTDVPLRAVRTAVTTQRLSPGGFWNSGREKPTISLWWRLQDSDESHRAHQQTRLQDGRLTCCLTPVNADRRSNAKAHDSGDIRPLHVRLRCQNMMCAQTEITSALCRKHMTARLPS